eukprot:403377489
MFFSLVLKWGMLTFYYKLMGQKIKRIMNLKSQIIQDKMFNEMYIINGQNKSEEFTLLPTNN